MTSPHAHLRQSSSAPPRLLAGSILLVVAALVATVLALAAAAAEDEARFTDSAEAGGHQAAVDTLAGWGYFEDTECDTDMFCPWDPVDRWVMAVWLVRALGYKPYNTDTSRFADVSADEW
ncbi:MAG: hypothetical protein OXS29_09355 [bacterium]|nr:hypothetical protein [bacterium]MDE0288634.1 hypothetical protein [bacterium]MDE0439852.1 hypothetical protein [bacterium]